MRESRISKILDSLADPTAFASSLPPALVTSSPAPTKPQPESKANIGELAVRRPGHSYPAAVFPFLPQAPLTAAPAKRQKTSAMALGELAQANVERLAPAAASPMRAPLATDVAPTTPQQNSEPGPYDAPPQPILVPNGLPKESDVVAITYDSNGLHFLALPSAVRSASKKEIDTYTYLRDENDAGKDWWFNLQELPEKSKAKPKCIPIMFAGPGNSIWTSEHPARLACLTCTNKQRLCLLWDREIKRIVILPLAKVVRGSATPSNMAYWVSRDPAHSARAVGLTPCFSPRSPTKPTGRGATSRAARCGPATESPQLGGSGGQARVKAWKIGHRPSPIHAGRSEGGTLARPDAVDSRCARGGLEIEQSVQRESLVEVYPRSATALLLTRLFHTLPLHCSEQRLAGLLRTDEE